MLAAQRSCCQQQLLVSGAGRQRRGVCGRGGAARVAAAAAPTSEAGTGAARIPSSPEQQVAQAVAAIEAAWRAGARRQRVDLLLPLIGATDLDDWPGGIRQQFKAAAPLVEQILRALKQKQGLEGPLDASLWDQGDAVGCWAGANLAAVLFPTGDVVDRLRRLDESGDAAKQLLLIFNPQWSLTSGPLTRDFGVFGAARRKEYAETAFERSYAFEVQRVDGDDLRVLHAYPGGWQVHVVSGGAGGGGGGGGSLLATFDARPTYAELQATLQGFPGAKAKKPLLERLKEEAAFIKNSASAPPPSRD